MTQPQSRQTDNTSDEPERESAAVWVETDTATDQDDENVQASEPVKQVADESQDCGTKGTATTSDDSDANQDLEDGEPATAKRRISWSRLIAYAVLPGLALSLAIAAGFLKWQHSSVRSSQTARIESVTAAKDSTIALLSYQPDTVEKDLGAARDRLTGAFQESYTQLTHDVVIPGAKQQHISAVATVPAAASVSATPNRAVALVFVDQTVVVGKDSPTATASSVRVTLDKIHGRWLISGFDPV